jgi:diacylglycerol kinase (ATP)
VNCHASMIGQIREALIIANPRAGRLRGTRARQLEKARSVLAAQGVETDLVVTSAPGVATAFARQAVRDARQMVIVCGGDGTVNEAVNGLAGSSVPLALLPAGTANVLAKELGLPWNLERAASILVRSELCRIALGLVTYVNGAHAQRYFLSIAGAGPDGAIVNGVDNRFKRSAGTLAYWAEGFRQLTRYSCPQFRATVADQMIEATFIIVGRTRHYGGPFQITTEASLYNDQFELMLCTARKPVDYLGFIPLVWLGQLRRSSRIHFLKTTQVLCEPFDGEPAYLQVDGEPAGNLPAEFSIVPNALTLAVPALPKHGHL